MSRARGRSRARGLLRAPHPSYRRSHSLPIVPRRARSRAGAGRRGLRSRHRMHAGRELGLRLPPGIRARVSAVPTGPSASASARAATPARTRSTRARWTPEPPTRATPKTRARAWMRAPARTRASERTPGRSRASSGSPPTSGGPAPSTRTVACCASASSMGSRAARSPSRSRWRSTASRTRSRSPPRATTRARADAPGRSSAGASHQRSAMAPRWPAHRPSR